MEYLYFNQPEEGFNMVVCMGNALELLGWGIILVTALTLVLRACASIVEFLVTFPVLLTLIAPEDESLVELVLGRMDTIFGSINEGMASLHLPNVDPWLGG